MGRFISSDGQISGVGGDVLGYNSYAYCQNNPVNLSDEGGNWPSWTKAVAKVALAIATVAIVTVAVTAAISTVVEYGSYISELIDMFSEER